MGQDAASKKAATPGVPHRLAEELRELTKAQLTIEHLADFQKEVSGERHHRGIAILVAATLENALDTALLRLLRRDRAKALFRQGAPLASFSNKILMGHALDIYGDQMFTNLDIIRSIRNAFAHAKTPLSFDTPSIAKACGMLKLPKPVPPHTAGAEKEDASSLSGLARYSFVADRISHNLLWHGNAGTKRVSLEFWPVDVDARVQEIVSRALPLP